MSKLQKKNILRSFCWFYLHYPIFLSSRDAYFVCYGSRKMTTFCNKNLKLQNFSSKTPQKHTRRITMSLLHTAYVLPTYKSILKHYNYVLDTVVYSPDSARYSNKTSEFCRVNMKIRWRVVISMRLCAVKTQWSQNKYITNFAEVPDFSVIFAFL